MPYETPLWNHFLMFDPIAGGLIGLIFNLLLWFMFIYPSNRGSKGAIEKTFYLMIPPLFIGSIVSYLTGVSLFAGLVTFIVYLVHVKLTTKMSNKGFYVMCLQISGLFILFAVLYGPLKMICLVFLIFKFMFQSQTKMDKTKNDKK